MSLEFIIITKKREICRYLRHAFYGWSGHKKTQENLSSRLKSQNILNTKVIQRSCRVLIEAMGMENKLK